MTNFSGNEPPPEPTISSETKSSEAHRHIVFDPSRIRKVTRNDKIARGIITAGGVAIIITVIGILALIINVSLPLFSSPKIETTWTTSLPPATVEKQPLAVASEEYKETAFVLTGRGDIDFFKIGADGLTANGSHSLRDDDRMVGVSRVGRNRFSTTWASGRVSLVEVFVTPRFDEAGIRTILPGAREIAVVESMTDEKPDASLIRSGDGVAVRVDLLKPSRLAYHVVPEKTDDNAGGVSGLLFGGKEAREPTTTFVDLDLDGAVTAFTVTTNGDRIFVGTESGDLAVLRFDEAGELSDTITRRRAVDTPISSLGMVFGDVSVVVGTAKGELHAFFPRNTDDGRILQDFAVLEAQDSAIATIHHSTRNKMIFSRNVQGDVYFDYLTSRRRIFVADFKDPLIDHSYAPRGDGLIGLTADHQVILWKLQAPHPETSWATLFGEVWYENYPEEDYVWQSTGGSDDFESKMSLVPLIFGTLKATFYAMIFALPIGVLGAIYISFFAHAQFRTWIKPAVELMAALPSVVIGFLVALWLAPLFESAIVGVFASLVFIPIFFLIFMFGWQLFRHQDWAKRVERGFEFVLLIPVTTAAIAVAAYGTPYFEQWFFDGDFAQWLYSSFDHRFDQRNSIVIAIGLGVAVIPIIFSISEDSLSSVPRELSSSSLALGASRWQTVWRIVVPSASPGIFAATMIGLGRAVGETMIVLMATGNTPIMDWSAFNGMRTLAANIAVEVPEAPVGGTLYRTLFLCSVILFSMTFVLNTAAEVIRHSLRKKYGRF